MKQPDLQPFHDWMCSRGRTEQTADLYCTHLRLCYEERNLKVRLLGDLSPNTKRGVLASLRAWAKFNGDGDLLADLEDVKLPAPERVAEKNPLTKREWIAICDAIEELDIDENLRAAGRMCAVRGFRVGDVCRLTRPPIRQALETGTLIYKAKSGRHLRWGAGLFSESLEQFLATRKWTHVHDLLAPGARPELRWRSGRQNVARMIDLAAVAAGIEPGTVSPHRLRRTYAVEFLKAVDGNVVKLKDHMGWASLQTAMSYVDHSQQQELDRVAAGMRKKKPRKRK